MIAVGSEIYVRRDDGFSVANGTVSGRLIVSAMWSSRPGQHMVDLSKRCDDGTVRCVVSSVPFPFTAPAHGRRSDGTSNVEAANMELRITNPELHSQLGRFRELAADRRKANDGPEIHSATTAGRTGTDSDSGDALAAGSHGLRSDNGGSGVRFRDRPSTAGMPARSTRHISQETQGRVHRATADRPDSTGESPQQSATGGTVVIIDLMNVLVAAFHAVKQKSEVHAVRSMLGTVRGLIETMSPNVLLFAAEGGHDFRRGFYPQYKANREETKPELKRQIVLAHEAIEAIGWPVLSSPGYEADDVLATVARQCEAMGVQCTVVSSDKDLKALSGTTRIYDQRLKKQVTASDVQAKFGVGAGQLLDFLALTGDRIDNVPGVPGIGEKTAAALLTRYGNLEAILVSALTEDHTNDKKPTPASAWSSLKEHRSTALLSRRLVELQTSIPLPTGWETSPALNPRSTWIDRLRAMGLGATVNGLSEVFNEPRTSEVRLRSPESGASADASHDLPRQHAATGEQRRAAGQPEPDMDHSRSDEHGDDHASGSVRAVADSSSDQPDGGELSASDSRADAGHQPEAEPRPVREGWIGDCQKAGFVLTTDGPDHVGNWGGIFCGQKFILHTWCEKLTAMETLNTYTLSQLKERANAA